MADEPAVTQKQQVCSIRIAFPVDSDEEAIKIKKQVDTIFAGKADSNIQFSILSGRPQMPGG